MRKRIFMALLMSVILFSCTSGDDIQEVTTEVNAGELMPDRLLKSVIGFDEDEPIPTHDYYQLFTYNNERKLTKVRRDYGSVYPVYLNLQYNGNMVTVENRSEDSSIMVPKKTVVYTLNNNGSTAGKYIPVPDGGNLYAVRKYDYEYNADGRLYKVTLRYPNITPGTPNYTDLDLLERVDVFTYEGKNLKKVVSKTLRDYNNNINNRVETVFSDYDNAKNPFRKLGLLDAYFYRSLSENNYREIKQEAYNENNQVFGQSYKKWKFSYDQNNHIVLSF